LPQAVLETGGEVRINRRLSCWVAAGGLGAWLLRFIDAERLIQELVRVGRAGMFGDEQ
jgi:hypothetical protein